MSDKKFLEIYTDGACFGNPGPGGWAAVLIWGDHIKKVSGFEEDTTNNRMELLAAIKALEAVKNPEVKIQLYTDSQYVKNGITKWIKTWIHTNWNKGKVKNVDLWIQLNDLNNKLTVQWHWVKAHNGLHYNEMVDKLAKSMIDNYLGTK